MRKTLILVAVLMLSAACLQAQQASSDQMAGMTTMQGCLKYAHGHFHLTDAQGTKHPLKGDINMLKPHIGHEVELTGKPSVKTTSTTMEGSASTATLHPVFAVESVKHIADKCPAK